MTFWAKQSAAVLLAAVLAVPAQAAPSRGLFVSEIQKPPTLSSREEIAKLVDFAKKARVKTLFVQVYREGRTWFPSRVGDTKPYEDALRAVSEDPLALLIRSAHAEGIEVHAWLNLLSLGTNTEAPLLKKYGPSILAQNRNPKHRLEEYKVDNHFFLEPGDPRVRQALSTLVGEVIGAYPELDGIQFDYIRYPDVKPDYGYAESNVSRYREATGHAEAEKESVDWKNWKREQVTGVVKLLAEKARRLKPGIQVSTTGLTPYSRARLESFQDWRLWTSSGLVDFVTLMSYAPTSATFSRYVRDAKRRLGSLERTNMGIGVYKLVDHPETFEKQWKTCEESGSRACVAFHYGDFPGREDVERVLLA